jgi:hypothetical protein
MLASRWPRGRCSHGNQVSEALALHAQTEEDVFYPAAILVGDMLRARQKK